MKLNSRFVFVTCTCGSGLETFELFDARGIYCSLYCVACEKTARARYRSEVLTNPNYECDEQIEPSDT
jgi:hypothetical protein